MPLTREEIDQIASTVADRMAATMPANLSIGAKVGIAVGGFFGSCAHVAGMIPGSGQVCDFGRGVKWGFSNKLAEYQIAEAEAVRSQAQAQMNAQAGLSGRPRTFGLSPSPA